METYENINDLCALNNVDVQIQNKVVADVEKNSTEKQHDLSLIKKYISKNVLNQLELVL